LNTTSSFPSPSLSIRQTSITRPPSTVSIPSSIPVTSIPVESESQRQHRIAMELKHQQQMEQQMYTQATEHYIRSIAKRALHTWKYNIKVTQHFRIERRSITAHRQHIADIFFTTKHFLHWHSIFSQFRSHQQRIEQTTQQFLTSEYGCSVVPVGFISPHQKLKLLGIQIQNQTPPPQQQQQNHHTTAMEVDQHTIDHQNPSELLSSSSSPPLRSNAQSHKRIRSEHFVSNSTPYSACSIPISPYTPASSSKIARTDRDIHATTRFTSPNKFHLTSKPSSITSQFDIEHKRSHISSPSSSLSPSPSSSFFSLLSRERAESQKLEQMLLSLEFKLQR
jgi:hypothetical protein